MTTTAEREQTLATYDPYPASKTLNFGLVLLRLLPGFLLFHGISKLTKWPGIVETVGSKPIGELAPTLFGFLIVAGEIVLPILIGIGFFTRIAALLESLMMLFIWLLVPVAGSLAEGGGFFQANGGLVGENAVAFLFALVPLIFTGPGRYSFDYNIIKKAPEGSFWSKFKKLV